MAIAQKNIDYAVEVDALLGLIVFLASEAKAGKAPSEIAIETLPKLIPVLAGIGQLSEELKNNKKAVEMTIGIRLGELVALLTA